ncbi:transposase [Gynuella sunshinyii]|uniref:Transposase IS200-like domain-containing protein n=1 Tax=Gynuella sunshinyii YC6258 TaxID=1445510 RepID=A0A0C5V3Z2_9GAMM|nr:transposase [Gynuella sunshinyii]AJQ94195.1 hypothetical Protein YC6258_02157 [Gynuella sunshinyii YC6258]
MTKPRNEQVSLEETSFYHCMVRCVRRAYLCGADSETGENFDHRKQWLVSRLRFLSYVYAIDICAYAIMSNHYHVVLHVDQARAQSWSDDEVVERWLQLYNGDVLINRWLAARKTMSAAELQVVSVTIAQWRERLCSISWFMRGVNETIARMANEEDNCKGRFWEGRFKSQALLDEGALLTCMAYVDLNPVRAAMADDLIDSDFTSIQQRLFDYAKYKTTQTKTATEQTLTQRVSKQRQLKRELKLDHLPESPLMPFSGRQQDSIHAALPFTREDYFDLIDTTGRCLRDDKRGAIHPDTEKLISRLGIDPNQWLKHVQSYGRSYGDSAGSRVSLLQYADRFKRRWSKGVKVSSECYLRTG